MINMDRLKDFFGENQKAIYDFLICFLRSTKKQLEIIEKAIQAKDNRSILYSFHQLKGSAANAGFKKVQDLCEKGEEKMNQSDWIAVGKIYLELDALFKKTQTTVETQFKQYKK